MPFGWAEQLNETWKVKKDDLDEVKKYSNFDSGQKYININMSETLTVRKWERIKCDFLKKVWKNLMNHCFNQGFK